MFGWEIIKEAIHYFALAQNNESLSIIWRWDQVIMVGVVGLRARMENNKGVHPSFRDWKE